MELTWALAGGLFAVFLGSLVQATAGLGYSLVAVPIAILFFPPQVAVPALLILGATVNAIGLYESRRAVALRRFLPFAVVAALFTPVGAYLLAVADARDFKLGVGVVILLLGALLLSGVQWRPQREWLAVAPVGILAGLLQGSVAMGAPPMAIFLTGKRVDKSVFRANMFAFLTVISITALLSYGFAGLLSRAVLLDALVWSPAMVVGSVAGVLLAKRLAETTFRKLALVIVMAGGVTSILSGVGIY